MRVGDDVILVSVATERYLVGLLGCSLIIFLSTWPSTTRSTLLLPPSIKQFGISTVIFYDQYPCQTPNNFADLIGEKSIEISN